MHSLPSPSSCPCGHAEEVERLQGIIDVLSQTKRNDTQRDEPSVSYTDPRTARIQAARQRMSALGWGGMVAGGA